jgi:hypothetical protein
VGDLQGALHAAAQTFWRRQRAGIQPGSAR